MPSNTQNRVPVSFFEEQSDDEDGLYSPDFETVVEKNIAVRPNFETPVEEDEKNIVLRQGDDLLVQNHLGYTPLHTACFYGCFDILKFFFTEVKLCFDINLPPLIPSLLKIACDQRNSESTSDQNEYSIIDYLHAISQDGISTSIQPVHEHKQTQVFNLREGVMYNNGMVLSRRVQ